MIQVYQGQKINLRQVCHDFALTQVQIQKEQLIERKMALLPGLNSPCSQTSFPIFWKNIAICLILSISIFNIFNNYY